MANLPAISVILTTCDRPEYLLAAAESVLAQRLPPAEMVVVDDGSGEHTGAMVAAPPGQAAVAVRRVRGPGSGPGAARNVGLRETAGEVVAFLDDDDLWAPEKLEWQAQWLAANPRLGVVGTDCVRARDGVARGPSLRERPRRLRRVSRGALLRGNRLVMSSVVARRECFEECGHFDESLRLAQDWDMWLRISERWEIGIVPAALTIYRIHAGQRSASRLAMRAWEVEVLERAAGRLGSDGLRLRGVARRRLAWAHCRLARMLARMGDRERGAEEIRRAVGSLPYHPAVWGALARCALGGCAPAGAREL